MILFFSFFGISQAQAYTGTFAYTDAEQVGGFTRLSGLSYTDAAGDVYPVAGNEYYQNVALCSILLVRPESDFSAIGNDLWDRSDETPEFKMALLGKDKTTVTFVSNRNEWATHEIYCQDSLPRGPMYYDAVNDLGAYVEIVKPRFLHEGQEYPIAVGSSAVTQTMAAHCKNYGFSGAKGADIYVGTPDTAMLQMQYQIYHIGSRFVDRVVWSKALVQPTNPDIFLQLRKLYCLK